MIGHWSWPSPCSLYLRCLHSAGHPMPSLSFVTCKTKLQMKWVHAPFCDYANLLKQPSLQDTVQCYIISHKMLCMFSISSKFWFLFHNKEVFTGMSLLQVHLFVLLLAHMHSTMNCIIYGFTNGHFSRGYRLLLNKLTCDKCFVMGRVDANMSANIITAKDAVQ